MPIGATLVVIGATGDLTGRLLLPALARLLADGELAESFVFVGVGPQNWTALEFRVHARTRLAVHASDLAGADRQRLVDRLDYRPVDVRDSLAVAGLFEVLSAPDVSVYLALSTDLVAITVRSLETLRPIPTFRLAVEKPFGDDLASAAELNEALHRIDPEDQNVFRVDHVLGMPAITALPSLLEAVPPVPADARIGKVSILWEETLALEGRAGFYDRAGALKDLLQNHLLQILCMVIMDPEDGTPTTHNLAQRRLLALQAVRVPGQRDAVARSRRARYTAGRSADPTGGAIVPDYAAEPGVDPDRQTETYAEVILQVTTPKWAETQFVLRAGKAMAQRRRGVLIDFTTGPGPDDARQSWIDVDQKNLGLALDPSEPSGSDDLGSAPTEQIAYVNVLRSLLAGTFELSVSAQEAERAWEIFEPFLEAWASGRVPLTEYPAGSEIAPLLVTGD